MTVTPTFELKVIKLFIVTLFAPLTGSPMLIDGATELKLSIVVFTEEQPPEHENVMVPVVGLAGSIVVVPLAMMDADTAPMPPTKLIVRLLPLGEVRRSGGLEPPTVCRPEFAAKEMDGDDNVSPLLLLTSESMPLLPILIPAPPIISVLIDTAPAVPPLVEVAR